MAHPADTHKHRLALLAETGDQAAFALAVKLVANGFRAGLDEPLDLMWRSRGTDRSAISHAAVARTFHPVRADGRFKSLQTKVRFCGNSRTDHGRDSIDLAIQPLDCERARQAFFQLAAIDGAKCLHLHHAFQEP